MKTNWLRTISNINAKRYVVPDGWDTRDEVAESLQCDPSKVADLVKPGIEAGEIERKSFPVWDPDRRMTVQTTCYRLACEKKPSPVSIGISSVMRERIASCLTRHPDWSSARVAKSVRGTVVADVELVRSSMK